MPKISLLVPYRNRTVHLRNLLSWFRQADAPDRELILVEGAAEKTVQRLVEDCPGARYLFVENPDAFHLSRLLNRGLAAARGELILPFDVDLLPAPGVFRRHVAAAASAPRLVVAGYRLLTPLESVSPEQRQEILFRVRLAASDHQQTILKRILDGESYGVAPILWRERLEEVGGWDEGFVGWGAEDQDLLERYLSDGRHLVRSEAFAYLHQHHEFESAWREPHLIAENRDRYQRRRIAQTGRGSSDG
ncbi:MAG: glycosyltransferase family 2 protein [Acidobacteriota bacterium]|nr:glycosyltransferase family 2 protein [Acidobacteriota bacterium]